MNALKAAPCLPAGRGAKHILFGYAVSMFLLRIALTITHLKIQNKLEIVRSNKSKPCFSRIFSLI
jgi:hypothetical protein